MTKKHFIALADTMREVVPIGKNIREQKVQWEHDINAIVKFCKSQNPNFMEGRWRDYLAGKCGPNGGKI